MSFTAITCAVDDGIARLTLNRPDRLNSFTEVMHAEIRQAMDALDADLSARVLVLSGAGRAFCAGQDLNDRAVAGSDEPPDLAATIEKNYKPLVLRLQHLRMPTICGVNGIAAGAGASLVLACDMVVAASADAMSKIRPGATRAVVNSSLATIILNFFISGAGFLIFPG